MALTTPSERDDLNRALTRLKSLLRLDEDGIASTHDLCSALKALGMMTDTINTRIQRIQEEDDELMASLGGDSDSVSDSISETTTVTTAPSPLPTNSRSSSFNRKTSESPILGRSFSQLSQRRAGSRTSCLPSFPERPGSGASITSVSSGGLRELRLVSKNRRSSVISHSPSHSPALTTPEHPHSVTSSPSQNNWDKDLGTLDTMITSARKSLWRNRLDLPTTPSNRRNSLPTRERSASFNLERSAEQDQKLHQSALRKRNSMRALYRAESPLTRKPSMRSMVEESAATATDATATVSKQEEEEEEEDAVEDSTPGPSPSPDGSRRPAPSSTDTRHSWDSGFAESPSSSPPATPSDTDPRFDRLSTLLLSLQAEAEAAVVSIPRAEPTPPPAAPASAEQPTAAEPEQPKRQHLIRQPTFDLETMVQELVHLQRGNGVEQLYTLMAGGGVMWLFIGWVLGWGCDACAAC